MLALIKAAVGWVTGSTRSMENPRRPLDPWSQSLGDNIDGSLSAAGVRVSREKALTLPAWFRGVSLLGRTVAKLPLGVYRKVRPGQEPDPTHPAYWLLGRQPNEAMTPFVWKQLVVTHVVTQGNHYSYISRDAGGRPRELLPLDPRRTFPVRERRGRLWIVHELKDGEKRKLPAEDVLHVKGLSFDGLVGHPVLAVAKDVLGGGIATQQYGGVFFRNNARPNVALKYPKTLSTEARRNLRESWERLQQGLDNAHRVAILEEGVDVVQLVINARDAQLIEAKQFSLIEVANLLNLPPHKLGANVSTSYGSLEQENQNFLDDAIDPWLVAIEEEADARLLSGHQRARDSHAIAFDRFPLLRADLGQRGDFYAKALQQGWMNWDEIRAREGLNPLPDGLGSVHYRPTGTVPVGGEDGAGTPGSAAALLDVPDVRQTEPYACGAAAVRSVCEFFDAALDGGEPAYLAALGTTPEAGTSPPAVLELLTRLGLCVAVVARGMQVEDLARAHAAGHPVLCPMQADQPSGEKGGHWVVVIGTGLGQVYVQDPAAGRRMLDEEDWLARWHDRDAEGTRYERYGIIVARGAIDPTLTDNGAPVGSSGGGPDAGVSAAGEVQDTALNGAQIASLLLVVEKQATKVISQGAAKAILMASFPSVDLKLIDQIVAEVEATPPPPQPDAQQQPAGDAQPSAGSDAGGEDDDSAG